MITRGITSDDKVGTMIAFGFQCLLSKAKNEGGDFQQSAYGIGSFGLFKALLRTRSFLQNQVLMLWCLFIMDRHFLQSNRNELGKVAFPFKSCLWMQSRIIYAYEDKMHLLSNL